MQIWVKADDDSIVLISGICKVEKFCCEEKQAYGLKYYRDTAGVIEPVVEYCDNQSIRDGKFTNIYLQTAFEAPINELAPHGVY